LTEIIRCRMSDLLYQTAKDAKDAR
jgi:hypothetical protein